MDEALHYKIQGALEKPGAFYALASDIGVIVIPELKIIIISTWS